MADKVFKKGDRVNLYGHVVTENDIKVLFWGPMKATVIGLLAGVVGGGLAVEFEHSGAGQMVRANVSPKQCRRLKPKRRRSVWVQEDRETGELRYGTWTASQKEMQERYVGYVWREFREVRNDGQSTQKALIQKD